MSGNSIEEQGFSEHLTDVLLSSWRPATQKQYAVYFFKKGLYSVVQEEIALCLLNLTAVLKFQHGTHNSARSALSCIISINGVPVGQHPIVCRFLKGAFQQKITVPL